MPRRKKMRNEPTQGWKHDLGWIWSRYLDVLISQLVNENGDRVERVVSISSCHFGFCCRYRMALLCRTTGFLLESGERTALPPLRLCWRCARGTTGRSRRRSRRRRKTSENGSIYSVTISTDSNEWAGVQSRHFYAGDYFFDLALFSHSRRS